MHHKVVLLSLFICGSLFCAGQAETGKISHGGIGFSVTPYEYDRHTRMDEQSGVGLINPPIQETEKCH